MITANQCKLIIYFTFPFYIRVSLFVFLFYFNLIKAAAEIGFHLEKNDTVKNLYNLEDLKNLNQY